MTSFDEMLWNRSDGRDTDSQMDFDFQKEPLWDYLQRQVEVSRKCNVSFFVKWNASLFSSMPQPFYIKSTQETVTVFCHLFTFGICADSASQMSNR